MYFLKEDASFVDVFHTSTTGVWKNSIGDVDVWFNGGLSQPTGLKSHKGAVFFFERSIILVPTELDALAGITRVSAKIPTYHIVNGHATILPISKIYMDRYLRPVQRTFWGK